VLEALTDSRVEGVVYIACSQGGGKTELLLNAAGYYIEHEPSPILLVEPNLEMAEALSKDRLAPMIRASALPIAEARSRDSGNTIRHKEFPGGHITIVGASSAAGLSMRPIRVLLFDEVDRYPPSAGTEGDPIRLAEARTSAFWNARKATVTSPGYKGGRSDALWATTDRCEWHIPCLHCGEEQWLRWEQVQWEKDTAGEHRPETAVYVCAACGVGWDDRERWESIRRGRYVATAPFRGWRGFRLPAMAVLGRKLEPMVRQWLEAQGHPEQIKAFKNTVRAEWYEEEYHALDETGLLARREQLVAVNGIPEMPAPCALLTAGVDVQEAPARLEVSVWAWARGEESWLLEHQVLYGDPAGPPLWAALDEYLRRPWPRARGGVDFVRGTCIDTGGHHTQMAYDFCGPRFRLPTPDGGRAFVFAVKGSPGSGDVWPRQASRVTVKVPLWPIRVDPAKEQLYGRLGIGEPGPGYIHLPNTVDERYCRGLVAEKIETTTDRKGRPHRVWKLKAAGLRNEPLDCAVYAYAALCGLRALGFDLEHEVERLPVRTVFVPLTAAQAPSAPASAPPAEPARPALRSPRGWIEPRRGWLRG
jgi:phage terminase large subunit GpA-like protein